MTKKIHPIAKICSPYKSKFGIPRQSGMVEDIICDIIFEPEYRSEHAIRGLTDFSHIWVIWDFTEFCDAPFTPTVRPPRLGGNKRMGVFATRSPNRPNTLGLSSLKLLGVDTTSPLSPVLKVSGADIMDGSAIYDIKPYIPFTDSHPNAKFGFAEAGIEHKLDVVLPLSLQEILGEKSDVISQLLALDPRPSYHDNCDRVYGMSIYGYNIKFNVKDNVLTVLDVISIES